MELTWVIPVSIALGMDAFSFSLALGLMGIHKSTALRLIVIVAVFHIFMPLLGLWAGRELGSIFGNVAVGVGAVVLLWLGIRMISGGLKNEKNKKSLPSLEGLGIYALAGSVSLDALSVGFSLGTFVTAILPTTIIIGITAGLMTASGLFLGSRAGSRLGSKAEMLGGAILVLIGLKMGIGLF